jgi:hypothetical protein
METALRAASITRLATAIKTSPEQFQVKKWQRHFLT